MAEAWVRHLKRARFEPYSAGVETKDLDTRAVAVMAEVGIDISGQRSKLVETLTNISFDVVVTLCDHAQESCPLFPSRAKLVHRGFDDPPKLAMNAENEEDALHHYRRVRDEIRTFVENLPESLENGLD
jgi:arsenate reductase (thioredoxin)